MQGRTAPRKKRCLASGEDDGSSSQVARFFDDSYRIARVPVRREINNSTARLLLLGHFGRLVHIGDHGGHGRKG